jgi:lysophospholipase L1-like esterase
MNFLKKIFSPTILTISFLLLIYTYYKSEIILDGNNRNYYKIYYLISSILIFFSIITFFINNKIKQYLIISSISIVISLYLFEGYLTFKDQYSNEKLTKKQFLKEQLLKEQLYENQTGNKWDKRNKLNIYEELKKNNNKITVSYHPSYLVDKNYSTVPFPLSGLSNSKTIYCNENGYYAIYQSDRYGFNNPDKQWDEKEIEYLLVGDSFTHGACVNRPKDISSVLRDISKKTVLNLGITGNGPLIQYATLREYLNRNVKKVLWIYFEGNDLYNLKDEKNNNILIRYLKDLNFTQNLKLKQNDIDILLSNLIKERGERIRKRKREIESESKRERERERERNTFKFKLIKFIKIFNTRNLILSAPASTLEFKEILQLTKELVNKNNSKLYFVYLPQYNRYKITHDNTDYNLVKNIVTKLKIPFIDVHKEVFEKEQNPLKLFPFELDGHYNVDGYKKVAKTIYKFTKN